MPSITPHRSTSVYLVDDHTFSRHAISVLINSQRDMYVCGETGLADIAVREITRREPEVAVVDLILDRMYGTELIRKVHTRVPTCRVLVLSVCDEHDHAWEAFQSGASGYVTKNGDAPERLLAAIRKNGPIPAAANVGTERRTSTSDRRKEPAHLNARDQAIIQLTALGVSATSVACQLHVALTVLRAYRNRIRRTLELRNGVQFVDFCIRQLRPAPPAGAVKPAGRHAVPNVGRETLARARVVAASKRAIADICARLPAAPPEGSARNPAW